MYVISLSLSWSTNPALYEEKMEKLRASYAQESDTTIPDEGSSVDPPPIDEQTEQRIVDSLTPTQTKPKVILKFIC